MSTGSIVLVALAIAIGLVGIIVPLLPGLLLVYAAILVWAVVEHTVASWVALGIVTVVVGATTAIKYLWPVRRMRDADVPTSTLLVGAVLGIVGFFVIPVLGLALGFVVGVYVAELARRRDQRRAWASTVNAVKGVALSVGVELAGGLAAAMIWLLAVLVT
ncbi:MAG TPA: DUF456 domain-containing protein [Mycobacterium sp.]|nr:DUF456 domain-containing protein [Mycobacterium sp.]